MRKNSSNSKLRVSVRFVQILVINSSMTAFVFLNISGIQFLKCSSLLGNHGNLLTVWKNETFSLTTKIFRQINSLVTYLVHISQKFRESNVFTEKILKNWFNEFFYLGDCKFFIFPHFVSILQMISRKKVLEIMTTSSSNFNENLDSPWNLDVNLTCSYLLLPWTRHDHVFVKAVGNFCTLFDIF